VASGAGSGAEGEADMSVDTADAARAA
jgi:hypothetical protein